MQLEVRKHCTRSVRGGIPTDNVGRKVGIVPNEEKGNQEAYQEENGTVGGRKNENDNGTSKRRKEKGSIKMDKTMHKNRRLASEN